MYMYLPWCTRIRASVPACSLLGGCLVHTRFTNILTCRTIFPYRTYPRFSPARAVCPTYCEQFIRAWVQADKTYVCKPRPYVSYFCSLSSRNFQIPGNNHTLFWSFSEQFVTINLLYPSSRGSFIYLSTIFFSSCLKITNVNMMTRRWKELTLKCFRTQELLRTMTFSQFKDIRTGCHWERACWTHQSLLWSIYHPNQLRLRFNLFQPRLKNKTFLMK